MPQQLLNIYGLYLLFKLVCVNRSTETKNDCVGEDQQQFLPDTRPTEIWDCTKLVHDNEWAVEVT
jgi:hypothetical protein